MFYVFSLENSWAIETPSCVTVGNTGEQDSLGKIVSLNNRLNYGSSPLRQYWDNSNQNLDDIIFLDKLLISMVI